MTINQSGIVKEQETTGQVDMDKGQEATDQADMDKGQETTDQANTCNTRSKKNNRNELPGAFLFIVAGGAIVIIFLVLGYMLGNNKFLGSFKPYSFGVALGTLLVLIKELFISRALNPNNISKLRAFVEVFVFVFFCAVVLYFTVETAQKDVNSLTLVVTIFLQNEISAKILK